MSEKIKESSDGFTVVELIVAMSVFTTVTALIVGIFVQSLRTQEMINSLMSVNSNASLVIEQVAREIRTGYNFTLSADAGVCDETGTPPTFNKLSFERARGVGTTTIVYYWDSDKKIIERQEGAGATTTLSASNVQVNRFCFAETKHKTNPIYPWRINMFLNLGSTDPRLANNSVDLETTVSARILPSELK